MKRIILSLLIVLLSTSAFADIKIGNSTNVLFASINEAKTVLLAKDDFVSRLSPFDRSSRIKTDRDVSEKEYLNFVGENILKWNYEEKKRIVSIFDGLKNKLEPLSLPFPNTIYLIKTTGKEEGGAAYTRGNGIILSKRQLNDPPLKLKQTICHELFHIITRSNPNLREDLYGTIGFIKCAEIDFPNAYKSQKITNPDAPKNDHCISIKVHGENYFGVPILYSFQEKYDVNRGGEFFNYLQFKFLLLDQIEKEPFYNKYSPKIVDVREVSGFFEKIGKNTTYIIHPEEILAENFAFMVLQKKNLPSPRIIDAIKSVLKI